MDISGKSVLLTGGTSGIGRELATQLQAKGAAVTVTGRNQTALEEMRAAGFGVVEADLTTAEGVAALVKAWGEKPLDILVNNAGMGRTHDFREGPVSLTDVDESIFTNLNAPIHLIARLMDHLRQSPRAMIVNVTSGLAITPSVAGATYCATKAGLRSYSISLRRQMERFGIHVLEVLPPLVETPMTDEFSGKKMSAAACASDIVAAIENDRKEANIGLVGLLRVIHSISPRLAQAILLREA